MAARTQVLQLWLGAKRAPVCLWDEIRGCWLPFDDWQALMAAHGHGSRLKACLYVSSQSVMVNEAAIDTRHIKKLGEQGLRYLFENISLAPTDTLVVRHDNRAHSTHGNQQGAKQVFYAICADDLKLWQTAASLYVEVVAILPDFLLLPSPVVPMPVLDTSLTALCLCMEAKSLLLYFNESGVNVGMSVPSLPLLNSVLTDLTSDERRLSITPVVGDVKDAAHTKAALNQALKIASDDEAGVDKPSADITIDEALTLGVVADPVRHPLNFLTASPKTSGTLTGWLLWLALALVLMKLIFDGLSYYHYRQANARLDAGIREQLRLWLPEATINSRTNIQAQLAPYLSADVARGGHNLDAVLASLRDANAELVHFSLTQDDTAYRIEAVLKVQDKSHIDSLSAALGQVGAKLRLMQIDDAPNDGAGQVVSIATVEIRPDGK